MRAARLWFDLGLFSDRKNIEKWSLCEGIKRSVQFVSPPSQHLKCSTFMWGIMGYASELLELEPFILARKLPEEDDYESGLWQRLEGDAQCFELHVFFLAQIAR